MARTTPHLLTLPGTLPAFRRQFGLLCFVGALATSLAGWPFKRAAGEPAPASPPPAAEAPTDPAGAVPTEAAPAETLPPVAVEQAYVGSNKCFICHRPQTNTYSETKHAHAHTNLPEKYRQDPACLKCHATAFNEPNGYVAGTDKDLLMVGCEACHGPGAKHVDAANRFVMANPGEEAQIEKEMRSTIVKTPQDSVCIGCHTMQGHHGHPAFDRPSTPHQESVASLPCPPGTVMTRLVSSGAPVNPFSRYSTKTCGGCHYDQYLQWNVEKHSALSQSLPAKYANDPSCQACHPPANGAAVSPSLASEMHHNWAGVVCESCHGSALNHIAFNKRFITSPPLGPALESAARESIRKGKPATTCIQCHVSNGHKPHVTFDAK